MADKKQDEGEHADDGATATIGDELAELLEGLADDPPRISSKYHYDEYGSQLFEQITRLDEYYPTRTERALLETAMPDCVEELRPATLVELGAGSAEKSRVILDAMTSTGSGRAYVPVDVSGDFLSDVVEDLERDYPQLDVTAVVGDIVAPIDLPEGLPGPRWIAFLGSTLGNFADDDAAELLRRVAVVLEEEDRFLLGVDLRPGRVKSAERIELAYNDEAGVTAAFSLNILAVVNDRFGSDFDLARWRHHSRYSTERGRIETSLVATDAQTVTMPSGERFRFEAGDHLRTEISCKYDRPTIDRLFATAGLVVDRWITDPSEFYALVLAAPAG